MTPALVGFLTYFAGHKPSWKHERDKTCRRMRIGKDAYYTLHRQAVSGGYLILTDVRNEKRKVIGQQARVIWRPLIEVEKEASASGKPGTRKRALRPENPDPENPDALKAYQLEEGAEERDVKFVESVEAEMWHGQSAVASELEPQERCIEEVEPGLGLFSLSDWQRDADDVTNPDAWRSEIEAETRAVRHNPSTR
jgi:hypothetical protein